MQAVKTATKAPKSRKQEISQLLEAYDCTLERGIHTGRLCWYAATRTGAVQDWWPTLHDALMALRAAAAVEIPVSVVTPARILGIGPRSGRGTGGHGHFAPTEEVVQYHNRRGTDKRRDDS